VKEYLDPDVLACRRFAKMISRMSSAVVVPSSAVARSFASSVNVIPDGCDVAGIRFGARRVSRKEVLRDWGLPDGQLVVAQVGTLQRWKGQHLTAEAFVRLSRSGDVSPFSLVFLGDGASTYKERLKQILAEAPDEWRRGVRFLDFCPNDFSSVAASDIVVHPSVLADPYPNAVREAMILGKPVIASRAGGIPDMMRHAETGRLIRPSDAGELAASLRRLINSPEERARLGDAAQRFAIDHFDINARKQPFLDLLRRLANMDNSQRQAT
jgi:glycosyltransferase involved in cell wall biosynthesis